MCLKGKGWIFRSFAPISPTVSMVYFVTEMYSTRAWKTDNISVWTIHRWSLLCFYSFTCVVWHRNYANSKLSYLDKLIKLNNKLLRILQHEPISTPVSHLYETYNMLPIHDLHTQQLLYFVYKCIRHPELHPEIFADNNYFRFNKQIHIHNTRNKTNIHLYHSNKLVGQRSIKHKATVLWNELPLSVQEITSLSIFKHAINSWLLLH